MSSAAAHSFVADGWLPVSFELYEAGYGGLFTNGGDEGPQNKLKVVSWAGGPLLVANSTVTPTCGVGYPCWDPRAGNQTPGMRLVASGGNFWVVYTSPDTALIGPRYQAWHLRYGFVSWWGLGYWCVVAALVGVAAVKRLRLGRRGEQRTAA